MIDIDKNDEDVQVDPNKNEIEVSWANKPDVRSLKLDLEEAQPIHAAQVQQINEYLDNYNMTGKAKLPKIEGASNVQPKLIRKQAEWRYPALSEPFLSQEDIFKVKPVTWEDVKGAKQNELLLNNQFNTAIDRVKFIDEYVRTAVDEGTVILRTGWKYVEEKYVGTFPKVKFVINPEFAPLHEQLAQMKKQSPSEYQTDVPEELKMAHELTIKSGNIIEPVVTGEVTEERTRVVANHPTVEVCDYRNTVIDPTCMGDIDKAQFVIHSFATSVSQLKKDGKYKNLHLIGQGASSPLSEPDFGAEEGTKNFQFSDQPRKKMVAYEYWGFWDINNDGILKPIVAAWVGDVLIRLEENPYPDGKLPFVVVPYLPKRKHTHGEPDGALLEDNQKVIGAVMRGAIDLMAKAANSQTGVRKGALDSTNRRKFLSGQDYEYNGDTDPRFIFHMHKYPEIPNSVPQMLMLQNQEAESLTGVKSFAQGMTGASLGDVAAGVRGALDAASKREVAILRRLANGIIAVARKWISYNAEFLSEEEVVRVTNDEFVNIKRDDLAGKFDLKLTISTAEEDEKKAQELAFMLQTMGNNMDFSMTKMILTEIARLRKMPALAKQIEDFEPQPDPIQQKKIELELAKLEAEIATERAKAAATLATAGLTDAKVGTEIAKARNLESDSDNKDLEFVERESGVTQERELQKVGEQARSQAQLKVIDHKLEMERMKNDPLKQYKASKK